METKKIRNGGFTLLETLLTVAILIILMALSAVGVARYKDYLDVTELDNAARDIYMAAENRAVLLQNSGASVKLLSTGGGGSDPVVLTSTQLKEDSKRDLLPAGTIDPALWKGDFRIVYDQTTGHVKEVFYAEKGDIGTDLDPFRTDDRSARVDLFRRGNTLVGYYNGGIAGEIGTKPLPTPGVEVFIDNGEELTLTVIYTLPEGLPTGYVATPSVKLMYGSTVIDISNHSRLQKTGDITTGTNATYTWVLDSLEQDSSGNYIKQFKDLGLTRLGGNFTVTAGLTLTAPEWIDSAYYAEGTDNSLFAKQTGDGDTAYIANLRHLQNLRAQNSTFTSGVGNSITKAIQIENIECFKCKEKEYNFVPIHNTSLTLYEGNNHEISNLNVNYRSNAGLFARIADSEGSKMIIQNLTMIAPRVIATGNAGAVVGRVGYLGSWVHATATIQNVSVINAAISAKNPDDNPGAGGVVGWVGGGRTCNISNCRVYWNDASQLTNESGEIVYKIDGQNAGGLVGSVGNGGADLATCTIRNSYASTTIKAERSNSGYSGTAGGLIGLAYYVDQIEIDSSYADCYIKNTAEDAEWVSSGGLVGRVPRKSTSNAYVKITNCYAAGFIDGTSVQPAGLFYGELPSGSEVTNCYSVVRVIKKGADGKEMLEKPATPLYGTIGEPASGSVRYLSKAEDVTEDQFGNAFEYIVADNSPETHVYDLRYEMSKTPGPADKTLKLTPPYPFPWLKNVTETVTKPDGTTEPVTITFPHYGDWAELEDEAVPPAGLVYYEVYQDSNVPGVWGVLEDGTALQNLEEDTDAPVVTKDGYALIFDEGEKPEKYEIKYGNSSNVQTWTLENLTWKNGDDECTVKALPIPKGDGENAKPYILIPLPDKVVTEAWEGITQYSKFYQKMVCGEGAAARTYWFNPHFAKTVKKSDSAPAEPSDSSSSAIIVRTPRHFWHMSAILYDDNISHQFYPGRFYYYYKQELDLDYGSYEGYPGIFEPEAEELPFKQLPIGSGGNFTGGSILVGSYDGGCHIIQNVLFSKSSVLRCIGLFGASQGTLKNIVYKMDPTKRHEANMRSYDSQNQSAGMLLGYNQGTVDNCAVYGANIKTIVTSSATDNNIIAYNYTGGLVGDNKGTIQNCSAEAVYLQAESTGDSNFTGGFVGGLVGKNSGTISSCYAVGKAVTNESDHGQTGGLVPTHSGGTIINSYAAVNLECKNSNNRFGLCGKSFGGTVDDASGWLKGTFRYRGEEYKVDDDTYKGAGTAMTPAQLAAKLTALAPAASTVHYGISSESWKGDYEGKPFPYLTGVKDGTSQPVHYGLWPVEVKEYPEVSLFYYEKYADNTFGFYRAIREQGKNPDEINTLRDDLAVVKDGYALAVPETELMYLDAAATDSVTVQYGPSTYTFKKLGSNSLSWSDSIPSGEANENGAFKQAVEEKGYILLPLRWSIHENALADTGAFYQTLAVTPKRANDTVVNAGKRTFYFNPHFAKALSCPVEGSVELPVKPAEPTQGANQSLDDGNTVPILVRTARHFYDISQFQTSYVAGKTYYFKQERDLDYGEYTGYSNFIKGSPTYAQAPVGTGEKPFEGVYDGQYHKLRSVTQKVSYTLDASIPADAPAYATGLFGYSSGTLKNIAYEPNQSTASSVILNLDNHDQGKTYYVGSLVGLNRGTVENCTAWNVRLTGKPAYFYKGLRGCQWKEFIYIGSLIGGNHGTVKNCGVTTAEFDFRMTFQITNDGSNGTHYFYESKEKSKNTLGWYLGGLAGRNYGMIEDCSAELQASVISEVGGSGSTQLVYRDRLTFAGGLIGRNESGAVISSSYAVGILGAHTSGVPTTNASIPVRSGFAAWNKGTIKDCYTVVCMQDLRNSNTQIYTGDRRQYFQDLNYNYTYGGQIQNCYCLWYDETWAYKGNDGKNESSSISYTEPGGAYTFPSTSGAFKKRYDELTEQSIPGMSKVEGTDVYPFPVGTTDKDGNYYHFGIDWPKKK